MSIKITLPDKSVRAFPKGITGLEIAKSISEDLAKKALVIEADGLLLDLSAALENDCSVKIITPKDRAIFLEIIRHDVAHTMAQAIMELYPDAQIAIGPVIENGFYYDVDIDSVTINDEILAQVENRMHEIVARDLPIIRHLWSKAQAIQYFSAKKQQYKIELIQGIDAENVTVYQQGDFIDLCRGPHGPSTGRIGSAFKLTKVAGAYWRGDSKNKMLQRIYGTAWSTKKELDDHLHLLAELKKRDHRILGNELSLFHLQEEAVGQVFWHPNGYFIYQTIADYINQKLRDHGYKSVKTPIIINQSLWEKSGHWAKFQEHMFICNSQHGDGDKGKNADLLAIKPMNCPAHVQIFKHQNCSYKSLPMRMSEFGTCHRNEPSGSLYGIMRVRGFTQDDAHIFCTEEQILEETCNFCKLLFEVYSDFGFHKVKVKFADRPEVRVGEDSAWDQAESALLEALKSMDLEYDINKGEGAFYGPKLEFVLSDALNRDWQCGTIQIDLNMAARLDATYTGRDGQRHFPVMIHRAILGTFERFIGILIEQYAGKFPLWLAPVQAVVVCISNEFDEYAKSVHQQLASNDIRAIIDLSAEKINYKVRKYMNLKTPFVIVIGQKEVQENKISVRILSRDENDKGQKKTENLNLKVEIQQFINAVQNIVAKKALNYDLPINSD